VTAFLAQRVRRSVRLFAAIALGLGLAAASAGACQEPADTAGLSEDDAQVWAAALDTLFGPRADGRTLLIWHLTETHTRENTVDWWWEYFYGLPGLRRSAAVDFERRNRRAQSLTDPPNDLARRSATPNEIVGPAAFTGLKRGWDAFYARFPNTIGTAELSAVGYDRTRSQAVVRVQNHCHWLCGEGNIVLLRRVGARWRVTRIHLEWVS